MTGRAYEARDSNTPDLSAGPISDSVREEPRACPLVDRPSLLR